MKLQNVYRMYKFTRGFMQLLKEQLTGAALYADIHELDFSAVDSFVFVAFVWGFVRLTLHHDCA